MTRIPWALVLALPLALAGCGPDCEKFCKKFSECNPTADRKQCEHGCNEVGSDNTAYIECYIDHSCADIENGHCGGDR